MKCYNIFEYDDKIKQYFTNLYIYSYDFKNEIIIRKYIYRKRYKDMWKFETIYSMKKYTVSLLCSKNWQTHIYYNICQFKIENKIFI